MKHCDHSLGGIELDANLSDRQQIMWSLRAHLGGRRMSAAAVFRIRVQNRLIHICTLYSQENT